MIEVLAARANLLRRPRWALETLVIAEDGERRVRKRVPDGAPADGRIDELVERHERLAAAGVPVRLPPLLDRGPDHVDVGWVEGETALALLERALLERRFAAAHAALDELLALLEAFPAVDADPYEHPEFAELFDPERVSGTGEAERCLSPGLYDFALGNLIRADDGGDWWLVDWEWTFACPVPVDFVRFVVVRNSAEYLQPLIRALASPELPVLRLFDELAVPEPWVRSARLTPAAVRRFLAYECSLQDRIHIVHRPFSDHVVHDAPERLTARLDDNAATLVERLEGELAERRAWEARLRDELAERERALVAAQDRLSRLTAVRPSARHLAGVAAHRLLGRLRRRG